jgi:polyisoprenoid-binding protein YceI
MFKRILIVIVVLAALGGATLFVLDRTLFAPVAVSTTLPVAPTLVAAAPTASGATAPSSATSSPTAATSSADSSAAQQVYRIDATQSEARYEVNETLFNENNRLNTAIGRTQGIAGDILVDFQEPANSQLGTIVIDISQFTSDESRRDNFIRSNGLQSARYPTATFAATSIEGLPSTVSLGDKLSFTVNGNLTVKQITKPVTWNVTLEVQNGQLVGSASTQILLSDYGAGPITLGFLQTQDEAKLAFDFVAVQAS